MPLARRRILCFSVRTSVKSGHAFRGFARVPETALAVLLMFLLLAAGTLSVCHALHQHLHPNSDAPEHICLVCALAKGQLSAAEIVVASVLLALGWILSIRITQAPLLSSFDYRLCPSRAPPRS